MSLGLLMPHEITFEDGGFVTHFTTKIELPTSRLLCLELMSLRIVVSIELPWTCALDTTDAASPFLLLLGLCSRPPMVGLLLVARVLSERFRLSPILFSPAFKLNLAASLVLLRVMLLPSFLDIQLQSSNPLLTEIEVATNSFE